MFKIHFSLIHNRGCEVITIQNRSAKRGMELARSKAWQQYDKSGATNWADAWLTITNPYGKVVHHDWAPMRAYL